MPAPESDIEPTPPRPLAAAALMVAGFTLVPCMDAVAKLLSAEYPVAQIAWARFTFHSLLVLPVAFAKHRNELWPRRPALQLLRGVFQLVATFLFFLAISRMPVANALALLFAYPLFVTLLSGPMLGERVTRIQWLAAVGGFLGVLVILRPGSESFEPAGLYALAAGSSFALYMIATRKVAGTAPPVVTLCYSALVGACVLSLASPWFWRAPRLADWPLMVLLGVFAASGHFLIVKAFELGPASRLAPLGYFEIVAATILGYLVFGEVPDGLTFAGIAIVVGAGIVASRPGEGAGVERSSRGSRVSIRRAL